jgi:uncharacterized membrane protein
MNKAQKIALLVGVIVLIIIFGQAVYKTGFEALKGLIRLPLKIIVVVVVLILIISFLKKLGKKPK